MIERFTETAIESHKINVLGSNIHYRKVGDSKQTFVFVHGMPTSSYLWRHVMPHFASRATCYAPDLIGMGESDKCGIKYTFEDHARYLSAFIEALDLTNITLIMHGWGAVVGMRYVLDNPGRIAGLVFSEAHIRPMTDWNMLALPIQEVASFLMNEPLGYDAIVNNNYFVETLLPQCMIDRLPEEVMEAYREPFKQRKDRLLLWQYAKELPLGSEKSPVTEWIKTYTDWLSTSNIPKLIMYAVPGFMTPISSVAWALDHWPVTTACDLPDALHLPQESCPHLFVDAMTDWLEDQKIVMSDVA